MRIIMVLTALLTGYFSFGQQKPPKPVRAPQPKIIPPPKPKPIELTSDEKCFVYTTEEKRDSLVYVTESQLEYGWAGSNARMIITTFSYDPAKKKVEREGYISGQSKSFQYINGVFTLDQANLNFTPDKIGKFEKRTFKLYYKPKTKKVDYIKDENNNTYKKGDCLTPELSL